MPKTMQYSTTVSLVPTTSGESRYLCRPHWNDRLRDGTVGVQTAAAAPADQGCEDCDQAHLARSED